VKLPNVAERRVTTLTIHFVVTRRRFREDMVTLLSAVGAVTTTLQFMFAATVMLRANESGTLYNVAGERVMTPKNMFVAREKCGRKYSGKKPSAVAANVIMPSRSAAE
jgi:hypothetical protein